jgi:hypothetical protein
MEVDIVALGSLAVGVAHMVTVQVDTYRRRINTVSHRIQSLPLDISHLQSQRPSPSLSPGLINVPMAAVVEWDIL